MLRAGGAECSAAPEGLQVSTAPLLLQLGQLWGTVPSAWAVPGSWITPRITPEGTRGGKNPKEVPGVHMDWFSGFKEICSKILQALKGVGSVAPTRGDSPGGSGVYGVLFCGVYGALFRGVWGFCFVEFMGLSLGGLSGSVLWDSWGSV